jgi:nitric oxide reductase large subunit
MKLPATTILSASCPANLTGDLIAYYRAEPEGFCGIDFSTILPFNICARGAFSWQSSGVSASYLATGIL